MTTSTILFVCTGNTCRSPMAEALAQKWLDDHGYDDWLAVSAGTHAIEGCPTSAGTVKALLKRGIVYEGVSKPLTRGMVRSAHTIFCMSSSHLHAAKTYANEEVQKVMLLDQNGSIADPVGQSQSVYDELAARLDTLISQCLKTIVQ